MLTALAPASAFDQFTYDLTTTNGSKFILVGETSAVTNTPLGTCSARPPPAAFADLDLSDAPGQVKLTNIGFTVPAGLIGLESLATYPTNVLSVDVMGGTADAIILAIGGAFLLHASA